MYSSEKHGSLQLAEAVQTQLLGILTARPLTGFRAVRGVRVEADELLATGESLLVRALPDAAGLTLRATVTDVATGRPAATLVLRRDADEVHTGELPPLAGRRLPPVRRGRRRLGGAGRSGPLGRVRRRGRRARRRGDRLTSAVAIHALLVAIDAYVAPITPLYGCRNDMAALRTYLEARAGTELRLVVMEDCRGDTRHAGRRVRDHLGRPVPVTSPCSPSSVTAARSRRHRRSPRSSRPGGCRRSSCTTVAGGSTVGYAGRSPTRSSACSSPRSRRPALTWSRSSTAATRAAAPATRSPGRASWRPLVDDHRRRRP